MRKYPSVTQYLLSWFSVSFLLFTVFCSVAHGEDTMHPLARMITQALLDEVPLALPSGDKKSYAQELVTPWVGNPIETEANVGGTFAFRTAEDLKEYAPPYNISFKFAPKNVLIKSELFKGTLLQGGATLSEPKRRGKHQWFSRDVRLGRTVLLSLLSSSSPQQLRAVLACIFQRDLPKALRDSTEEPLPDLAALIARPVSATFQAKGRGEGAIKIGLLPGRARVAITVSDNLPDPEEPQFEQERVRPRAKATYYPITRWKSYPLPTSGRAIASMTVDVGLYSGPGHVFEITHKSQLLFVPFMPHKAFEGYMRERFFLDRSKGAFSCAVAVQRNELKKSYGKVAPQD